MYVSVRLFRPASWAIAAEMFRVFRMPAGGAIGDAEYWEKWGIWESGIRWFWIQVSSLFQFTPRTTPFMQFVANDITCATTYIWDNCKNWLAGIKYGSTLSRKFWEIHWCCRVWLRRGVFRIGVYILREQNVKLRQRRRFFLGCILLERSSGLGSELSE